MATSSETSTTQHTNGTASGNDAKTWTGLQLTRAQILNDYRIGYRSRQASLLGRREVLTGKAKFGIFGDGKELPQIAMARAAQPGDMRSGYYRDQTFMMACGLTDIQKFFAQLYADAHTEREPASGGRQMNAHYSTRLLDENGEWLDHMQHVQSSADGSPTASQMPRMVGIAQASTLYRQLDSLQTADFEKFSNKGNEICFGTIGDASTSEGLFWETMNAVGVLQVPLLMSVWDDNYGISVPIEYQTTKGSISEALKGLHPGKNETGVHIYKVKGWNYVDLMEAYAEVSKMVREEHVPALIHVEECTQPQGHSTSGSHERYKSKDRLAWEEQFDGLRKMREWMEAQGVATAEELDALEKEETKAVRQAMRAAWEDFQAPIADWKATIESEIQGVIEAFPQFQDALNEQLAALGKLRVFQRSEILPILQQAIIRVNGEPKAIEPLNKLLASYREQGDAHFNSHLYSTSAHSPMNVEVVPVELDGDEKITGFDLLNQNFEVLFNTYPELVAFGEDLGKIGDVNQGFRGLQDKFGETRIFDTGIRESTIMGQGIGMALRGLRPIAEIQYLDYVHYAIQTLSDDLATLHWRTAGGQKAPLIVRTRGHRLEGIWHSGSHMGMYTHALRGMHLLVPRNMTQAAGFYNTLLQGDDPALVVEVLNGYRLKEAKPKNLGEFTVPLGIPETLRQGEHITLVTYGALCRIAAAAADDLAKLGIEIEIIDVQSLLPFDIEHRIVESLKKTNRLMVVDEDVPGGASAYIMQHILQTQGGYYHLDSEPTCLTAHASRPAYASDGDYFSKPQREDIVRAAYRLMHEFDPQAFPALL